MIENKKADCVFCKIIAGEIPSEKVWENEQFIAIKEKYPSAPIHILVIPKSHIEKAELREKGHEQFWGEFIDAVFDVVRLLGLDKTGYRFINNGAGYNHIEHDHFHIHGGG